MFDWLGFIFSCGIPAAFILLGLLVGGTVERLHFRNIAQRESAFKHLPTTDLKTLPPGMRGGGGRLVMGSVVIATDYFKTFVASLRKLIGGEIASYERLMERARREAICRMLEEAQASGAVAVINVRIETSNVGGMSRNPTPMVEVIAYGTAVLPHAP